MLPYPIPIGYHVITIGSSILLLLKHLINISYETFICLWYIYPYIWCIIQFILYGTSYIKCLIHYIWW